jgi:acetyl esterase/lipase
MRAQTWRATVAVAIGAAFALSGYAVLTHSTASGASPLSPVPAPTSLQDEVVKNVVYSPDSGLRMDLYFPQTPGPHPVIVWAHGGGWITASKDDQPVPDYLLRQITRRNFVVASIDYRLAGWTADGTPVNPFPAAVEDVKTAIRFVKASASRFGLDPDMVFVAGHSAGGQLAALVGASAATAQVEPHELTASLSQVDSRVRAVIDVAGPSNLQTWGASSATEWTAKPVAAFLGCRMWTAGPPDCPVSRYAPASIGTYLSPASPPAFLAYGALDRLVSPDTQGAPLAAQWVAAKGAAAVVYDVVPGEAHNIDGNGIDNTALDTFVDGVLAGTIR